MKNLLTYALYVNLSLSLYMIVSLIFEVNPEEFLDVIDQLASWLMFVAISPFVLLYLIYSAFTKRWTEFRSVANLYMLEVMLTVFVFLLIF